jgi:hypothetical protein
MRTLVILREWGDLGKDRKTFATFVKSLSLVGELWI